MSKSVDQLLDEIKYEPKVSTENAVKEFALIRAKVQNIHTPLTKEEKPLAERIVGCIQAGKISYNKENQSVQYFFTKPLQLTTSEVKTVQFKHITRATLKAADVKLGNLIHGYNEEEIEKAIQAFTGMTSEFLDKLTSQEHADLISVVQLFLV